MRKQLFPLLLCVLSTGSTLSQATLPDTFQVKTDTVEWQEIAGPYLQVLADTSDRWSINDVAGIPLTGQFQKSVLPAHNPLALANTYWFRYVLKNNMQRDARISLNSMSDYDDFYVQDGIGKWKYFVSGRLNEWTKKAGLKRADCIPVTLVPGEVLVIYQQVRNKKAGLPADFSIAVVSTDKVLERYYIREDNATLPLIFTTIHVLEGFIIGFLLFSSVFNLFYFGVVRERVYLYFSLFLFFLSVNRCWNIYSAYNSTYNPPLLRFLPLISMAWIFIQYFLYRFVRSFFKVKEYFPKWDKALRWLSIMAIVAMLSNVMLVPLVAGPLASLFRGLGSISFIIIFLPLLITLLLFLPQARLQGFVRLMIIGALPYIAWNLFSALIQLFENKYSAGGLMDTISHFSKYYFRPIEVICMSCFVLFSSRILFLRYGQLQKEHIEQVLENEKLAREKEVEKNQLIEQQKAQLEIQVEDRTKELRASLDNLKTTQSQLIQSEKMASLGELTAGIAHEIQNPLNFVNNFSEINIELIEEFRSQKSKGKTERDEELEEELIEDILKNSEKINHHGKRADAIVKGMLQHSRSSSSSREPVDINKLADEYLRLAYHGLRAKDKSFNAALKTDYDVSAGLVNIIPQDIGRVILNLITNAFYAVSPPATVRTDVHPGGPGGGEKASDKASNEPTVWISTKRIGNNVLISVKDNGAGIPPKILDKIFQPFFTTKPTGQGTGLGLSLAYDIVKAHGGELTVETKEGEGSIFTIQLPGLAVAM